MLPLSILTPSAQAQDESVNLLTDPFYDLVRDRATISGGRIAGFQAVLPAGEADHRVLAWIPADWAGREICLRAMSADGLYEAIDTYKVPDDWRGGLENLEYPTKHAPRVTSFEDGDIAVSVQAGDCDTQDENEDESQAGGEGIALALWNAGAADPMRLLVNSFRADEALIYYGSQAPIACTRIEDGARVAFDMTCTIPPEVFVNGVASLVVMTIKDGELGDEVPVTLLLGPLHASP